MKTTRVAIALGVAILGASAAFIACSSDQSTLPPGNDASPDGTFGRDAGTGPKDSGGGDRDAGPDASSPYDPGKVSCGGSSVCAVPAQVCCLPGNNSDAGFHCEDGGPTSCRDRRVECDEAADCLQDAGAAVCCNRVSVGGGGPAGSRMVSTCEAAGGCSTGINRGHEACKTDLDCGDGGAGAARCVTQTCRGRTVRSCGGFPANDAGVVTACN